MLSVPAVVPDAGHALQQVAPAGGDHLVGDLEQQRGHPLRGVVVLRDGVDHLDTGHQAWNVLQHPGLLESREGNRFTTAALKTSLHLKPVCVV